MISEIDTSSVVDETESAKVTTESQMAECSTELMWRPVTYATVVFLSVNCLIRLSNRSNLSPR